MMVESKLIESLLARGCILGQAATPAELSDFETANNIQLHHHVRSFYKICSGLEVPDVWLISVWPLNALQRVSHLNSAPNTFSFGDFMLYSEEITTDVTDPNSPVRLLSSDQLLAPSFNDFIGRLLSGSLDIGT